ncbi:hypothetical protein TrLO_g8093 [Triparma laevis f. longispina]|uniref:Uncharacterized protein n=1 Tax=Triparma laevis f. longispina TaxID=1714387 RepID=A0A9W7E659_9STRA|nr:hypothetical protein TrLO_g8093 [Triparma laevis f. longispina]
MVGGLLVVQIATFVFFLKNINPKYISTFYSTKSGSDHSMENFLNHDDDEKKIKIFENNRHKWKKIEEDAVKVVEERRGSMRSSMRGSILNVTRTDEQETKNTKGPGAQRRRTIKAKAKKLEREINA